MGVYFLWLAVGPAENLPIDVEDIEEMRKMASRSSDPFLRRLREAADRGDPQEMDRLVNENERERAAEMAEREAKKSASVTRRRWQYSGWAITFLFIR